MAEIPKPKKRKGHRPIGFTLLSIGVFLLTFLRVPAFWRLIGDNATTWLSIISYPLIIIGGVLVYRGGQYASAALARDLDDAKAIVLYLRPFKTDVQISKFVFTQFYWGGVRTTEEQLAEVLKPFGRLLAIGQPGEELPIPGAARIYAAADWKNVVADKMKTSGLVIILAGTGTGLLWELKEAFELVDPRKILILVPVMRRKAYEAFRLQAEASLKIRLPEGAAIKQRLGLNVAEGFIQFTSDWKSSYLRMKSPVTRVNPYLPYLVRFKLTLKPLFEEYGIEWRKPPYSWFFKTVLWFFLIVFLLLLLLFVIAALQK
jgi:hypothetical protein